MANEIPDIPRGHAEGLWTSPAMAKFATLACTASGFIVGGGGELARQHGINRTGESSASGIPAS